VPVRGVLRSALREQQRVGVILLKPERERHLRTRPRHGCSRSEKASTVQDPCDGAEPARRSASFPAKSRAAASWVGWRFVGGIIGTVALIRPAPTLRIAGHEEPPADGGE
jgi:hypothetical protein